MNWREPITSLKGIGPKTAEAYHRLHIDTVGELLSYLPRHYETFEADRPIGSVKDGQFVTVLGTFTGNPRIVRTNRGSVLMCDFADTTGKLHIKWFNQPYLRKQLQQAKHVLLRGSVRRERSQLVMTQPEMYTIERYRQLMKTLRPVYGLTSGVTGNGIAKAVSEALAVCEIPELLPAAFLRENNLWKRKDAFAEAHFPKSEETTREALRRLAFDEFYRFLLAVRSIRKQTEQLPNRFPVVTARIPEQLIADLPYSLTGAQSRAWEEIRADLAGGCPMQRLLQGDVGSGKTVIAELALAAIAENGHQGCLMVPTEVLARQHYRELSERLGACGIKVGLLTGAMGAAERRLVLSAVMLGQIQVLVGTHALFQQGVGFADLGLVIVDEQHRFGVEQRRKLSDKGAMPHLLLMSATPIPRTLAMMLYADLDVSVLDEMPKNRLRVKTAVVDTGYRARAYRFFEEHIAAGDQCYVVCPLIEESDGLDAVNVTDYAEQLTEAIPSARVAILHGRMSPKEKTDVMEAFAAHAYDILVSTTVIEVGIDVANATVILVENAERFGLAQLHQLRGRVGRGAKQSFCILVQGTDSDEAKERLSVLLHAADGFAIAQKDLELRGPGDFFGIRQSGEDVFRMADPIRDAEALMLAKRSVESLTAEQYDRAVKVWLADEAGSVVY